MKSTFLKIVTLLAMIHNCGTLTAQDIETPEEESNSYVSEPDAKELTDIIEAQLKAIRSRDINKAYYSFGSEDFQKTISFADFKRLITKYNVLSDNKSFLFERKIASTHIVVVKGKLTSNAGESLDVEYSFVHEYGEWRILGIQLYTTIQPKKRR